MIAVSSAGSAKVTPCSKPARKTSLMSCPASGRSSTTLRNSSRSPTAATARASSSTPTRCPRRSTVSAFDSLTTSCSDADREYTTAATGAWVEIALSAPAAGSPRSPSAMSFSKRVRIEFISKRSKNAAIAARSQPPRVRLCRVKSSGTSRTSVMTRSFWRARSS